MFRLASPWALVLLPLVLGAAWRMARLRRRGEARIPLPMASARLAIPRSPWARLERGIPWLRALILLLLALALARPQSGTTIEKTSTLGVDLVLALDISGSMRAEDFKPDNRLAVARRTVDAFVAGRPGDRVGLVAFAALATTRCPLTQDHEMFRTLLETVDFAPRDQDGTALGMGLATAVNRLRDSKAKSRVAVLVTDGVNNAGEIGPLAAAEAARALGVRVYTIGVGTEGKALVPIDTPFGVQRQSIDVELDEELLREIARVTDGEYFRATDTPALEAIFETIDSLEKTEIESSIRVLYRELFPLLLLPAVLLFLLERLLVGTRLRRIPA